DRRSPPPPIATTAAPAPASSPWFFRPDPDPRPRLRLFCFPHLGGLAQRYAAWPRALPPGVEVCAVQLPGRSPREDEPPIRDVEAPLAALEEAMLPLGDAPFAFFGHSGGALVAFELARHLRRKGRRLPEKLLLSAPESPDAAAFVLSPWQRADIRLIAGYRYE